MESVADRIDAVLRRRRQAQPRLDEDLVRWEGMRDGIGILRSAVEAAKAAEIEVSGLGDLNVEELARLAEDSVAQLQAVRVRVARRTVNIGVSGQARNGKSTLLQSMSDLDDEQIPTGAGGPVTAVRSRIFHSRSRREALLTMHTEASFCEQVLAAYAGALSAGARLQTLDDLRRFDFAGHRAAIGGRDDFALLTPMLVRLQEMRDSLESFRPLLTGETRRVALEKLREWVAYPKENTAGADRRYLAVRDAEIHCPFPLADDVANLGLIDLPGLGEIVPSAEEHHIAGLQNDVDFVLVVKRPTDGNQLWKTEDAKALQLIGQARGAAALRDFASVLVNTGEVKPEQLAAVKDDILKRVNDGTPDSVVRVREADVLDRGQVRADVLGDSLAHLAEALPRMDAAAFARAERACSANAAAIGRAVEAALAALRSVITPTPTEVLVERAALLRKGLAGALRQWMAGLALRAQPNGAFEDKEFLARADAVRQDIREWVMNGFGEGVDAWAARALEEMYVEAGAAVFAERALNAVRVEIAERFSQIDRILAERRTEFWQGLVDVLATRLGPLLDTGAEPEAALQTLATQLREADAQCPNFVRSLEFVLDIRLDYRTRTLPRLRQALSGLQPEPAGGGQGALQQLLPVDQTPEGAKDLYMRMELLARAAVHEAGAVLAEEPAIIAQALFAYGEQFEDAFIRSDASEREFRRIAESFRDQLWPRDDAAGIGLANVRVQRIRSALTGVGKLLADTAAAGAGKETD